MDTTKVANTNGTTPATPSKPSRAGAVATWADERLGLASMAKKNAGRSGMIASRSVRCGPSGPNMSTRQPNPRTGPCGCSLA